MAIRRSLAALLFVAALAPSAALAQSPEDVATARNLANEGFTALDAKDFAKAADLFKRADSLYHAPTISLGLGRAYAGLGKLMSAQEAFSKAAYTPVPPNAPAGIVQAVAEAQAALAVIAPRVPGVILNIKGPPEAKVTIDGVDVPAAALGVKRPLDPGTHLVRVIAPGYFTGEAKVTLVESKVETVNIEIKPDPNAPKVAPPPVNKGGPAEPPPPPAPPPSTLPKTLGFVGLGVGGAGLILGAVTGGLALSKHSALITACGADGHCALSQQDALSGDVSAYKTMGTLSTAGFIAGGALAATGVILLVTAPKAQKTGSITPMIGPGFLGAAGTF